MYKGIFLGLLCLLSSVPFQTNASPIIRTGESISIDSSQVLESDFYGLAPSVTISGEGKHDVYIGGGTVIVNAPISEDLTTVGGTVQVHGDIGDDLRVVGGEVTLTKLVRGDVVVVGGTLTILSTAQIEGDVVFLGGKLVIEGDVGGSVHGTAESIRIDSHVDGDVSVTAQSLLTLGERARVSGNVYYTSAFDVVRAPNAEIVGDVQKTHLSKDSDTSSFGAYVALLGVLLFSSLAFFLVARKSLQHKLQTNTRPLGIHGLIGLLIFLVTPFVAGVFVVSFLGFFVGIALFLIYGTLLIFSGIWGSIGLGYIIQKYVLHKSDVTVVTVCLGCIAFVCLAYIPYVGGLCVFALVMIALGYIGMDLYRRIQP